MQVTGTHLMLWILTSLFFLWCAFHEVRTSLVAPPGFSQPLPLSKPYLAVVLALAVVFAWPPVHTWFFERFLSAKATELADGRRAKVHCNTVWDTMLDREMFAAGHANPDSGEIGLQHPWCSTLRSYLNHPDHANEGELWSLAMFTHESMHVRGELNEARTECEAVQRNYRAAKLLGVPDTVAKRNALDYYNILYKERAKQGIMQAEYYSDECAPGKAMDEYLSDSTWAP
jgi:hypothetical protein